MIRISFDLDAERGGVIRIRFALNAESGRAIPIALQAIYGMSQTPPLASQISCEPPPS